MRSLRRNTSRSLLDLIGLPLRLRALLRLMELRCERLQVRHTEEVVCKNSNKDVKQDERKDNAKITPPIAIRDRHRGEELVAVGQRTVLARRRGAGVLDCAAGCTDVFLEICAACLTGRGIKDRNLAVAAVHLAACEHGGDEAADPVCEWRNAVHEQPKSRELAGRLQDTVEQDAHEGEQGDEARCCFGVGQRGDSHASECRRVDEQLHHEQEDQALTFAGLVCADDGVVEACKGEHAGEDAVGNFDDNVGDHESDPGVCFAGALARLVERALSDE
jgi:hypothetical protein